MALFKRNSLTILEVLAMIIAIPYVLLWAAYKALSASIKRFLDNLRSGLRRELLTVYPLDHTMPRLIQFVYAEILDGGWWHLRPPLVFYMPLYRVTKRVFQWNGEWYCETTLHDQ